MKRGPGTLKVITGLERLNNSVWGNPRYRAYFEDGTSAITSSDASVNYALPNPEYRDRPVYVWFTRAGRICYATPAEN
jgi:hypothetical protein